MISEPELTGGAGEDGRPVDLVADTDGAGFGDGARPAARPRPPWVWVLGAVLLTSAVWAGGTYAYDRGHDGRPDLHGYRLGQSPCGGSTFKPLTDAVGAKNDQPAPDLTGTESPATQHRGAAVDRIRCDFNTRAKQPEGGGTTAYAVMVGVDLHKKVDPRTEFDDDVRVLNDGLTTAGEVNSVPELGDKAYFLSSGTDSMELKVLDGGAVFTLDFSAFIQPNVSEDTLNGLDGGDYPLVADLTQYRPAMIQVTRNLMSALRKN
ncbi:hypothetical protein [Actinacidiphila alni]|uniref:hypothetical protein n=1 Tax=Actinacidiphila alni TaxID=380248 RepID=UPI003455295F